MSNCLLLRFIFTSNRMKHMCKKKFSDVRLIELIILFHIRVITPFKDFYAPAIFNVGGGGGEDGVGRAGVWPIVSPLSVRKWFPFDIF